MDILCVRTCQGYNTYTVYRDAFAITPTQFETFLETTDLALIECDLIELLYVYVFYVIFAA